MIIFVRWTQSEGLCSCQSDYRDAQNWAGAAGGCRVLVETILAFERLNHRIGAWDQDCSRFGLLLLLVSYNR